MTISRRQFCFGLGLLPFVPLLSMEYVEPAHQLQNQPVIPLLSPIPGTYSMNVRTFAGMDRCNVEVTRYDEAVNQSIPVWSGTADCESMLREALEFIDKFRTHSRIYVYVVGRVNTYSFIQQASSRGSNVMVAWHV